ncbi:MAG: alpha-1,4-glucan--maltose-1-phosphate maltosyltransferase [Candidatus Kapaibacterium sp.]
MRNNKRVIIENLKPQVNCGEFPIKRVLGESVEVTADIICDGHDVLSAELLYRYNDNEFKNISMNLHVNDKWQAGFVVQKTGIYSYTVQAWPDHFKTWHRDILKKIDAEVEYAPDLITGADLIDETLKTYSEMDGAGRTFLENTADYLRNEDTAPEERASVLMNGELFAVMAMYPVRKNAVKHEKELIVLSEPIKARFSAWYELFPRSVGVNGKPHGTFSDVEGHLDYISALGFDVLYLPPIHPIGESKRKGKNNSTSAEEGEPGSPWAIGGKEGGHKAIHPDLGTMDDFISLVQAAKVKGIDIALDIAFQCSPDHPYVMEHPEWFRHRPDGSIQYAENPPKKYEDIYPFDFETEAWGSLWDELKSIFTFWINKGVKVFRVDNPHTKSLKFWGWVINEIKKDHPEVIFLSEAFTRPKVMYRLAKEGFTQSYTYFTWRNTKWELENYMTELVATEVKEFFRPNFWPNTPDILPEFLQHSGRPGFLMRFILAATLSSNYGIYGPAYELMEAAPREPGKEEYLDSEKYEVKKWDRDRDNNLKKMISRVNRIRRDNPALHQTNNIRFHHVDNHSIIAYSKQSPDGSNTILTVVNLDPYHKHSGWIQLPLNDMGLDAGSFQAHDLLSGAYYMWQGEHNYVEIDPGVIPAHIFKIRRRIRTEKDFDYFM